MSLPGLLTLILIAGCILLVLAWLGLLLGARLRPATLFVLCLPAALVVAPAVAKKETLAPPPIAGSIPGAEPGLGLNSAYNDLNDVQFQLLPWELEVRRLVGAGSPPFWSHRIGGGSCLWCNPQAQTLSTIAWIARIFPLGYFLLAALVLKVLVAAVGGAVLGRLLGLREAVACWAGAAFALCGGMLSWAVFPLSSSLAWVAWCAAGSVSISRLGLSAGRVLLVPLLVANLTLSGHPETAVLGMLFALTLGLAVAKRGRKGRVAVRVGALALAGIAISAPGILPTAFTILESLRFAETRTGGPVVLPATLLERTLSPPDFAFLYGPLGPDVYGKPYGGAFKGPYNWATALASYCGVQALLGWSVALCGARRRLGVLFWFTVLSMLAAMRLTPLDLARAQLPILDSIASSRFLPVACLPAVLFAALGWADVVRGGSRVLLRWPVWTCVAGSLYFSPTLRTLVEWAVTLAIASALNPGARLHLLPLSHVALMASWGWSLIPSIPPGDLEPESAVMARLRAELAGDEMARTIGFGYTAYPNLLPFFGVSEGRVHDPLAPAKYLELLETGLGFSPSSSTYFAPVQRVDREALNSIGVCCVFSKGEENARLEGAEVVPLGDGFQLIRDRCLVRRIVPPESRQTPDASLGIEGRPGAAALPESTECRAPVSIVPRSNELRISGRFATGTRIRTLLQQPDAWTVSPTKALRRRHVESGVFLELETNEYSGEILVRFMPRGLFPGLALATVGLAAMLAWARRSFLEKRGVQGGRGRRSRRREQRSESECLVGISRGSPRMSMLNRLPGEPADPSIERDSQRNQQASTRSRAEHSCRERFPRSAWGVRQ